MSWLKNLFTKKVKQEVVKEVINQQYKKLDEDYYDYDKYRRKPFINDIIPSPSPSYKSRNKDENRYKPHRSNDIVDDVIDIAVTSIVIDSLFGDSSSSSDSSTSSTSSDFDFGGGDFGGGGAGGDDW